MNKKMKKGFTLIELLVVSTIIIILSAIGLVSFVNAGQGARDAKRKADLETVRQALVLYRSDVGNYPVGSAWPVGSYNNILIPALSGDGYISSPTPLDPKDVAPYRYGYASDGITFSLTATLEKDESVYTLTNP